MKIGIFSVIIFPSSLFRVFPLQLPIKQNPCIHAVNNPLTRSVHIFHLLLQSSAAVKLMHFPSPFSASLLPLFKQGKNSFHAASYPLAAPWVSPTKPMQLCLVAEPAPIPGLLPVPLCNPNYFTIQTASSPMDPAGWTTNYLLPTPVSACALKNILLPLYFTHLINLISC